jgi:DNA-binding NarL/FixJ family response regulator
LIRVVLVDDHEVLREGLVSVMSREPGIEVVGSSGNAEEALKLLEELEPDVVTLDLSMPGMGGREAAVSILSKENSPRLVVVSSEVSPATVQGLVNLGVHAYVSKSAPSSDVVRAVKMVMAGQNYFSPDVMTALLQAGQCQKAPKLTLRQMEVLTEAAKGLTTKDIADKLHVSPKTVEKYRGEIIARLESKNLVEAINKARQLKILE